MVHSECMWKLAKLLCKSFPWAQFKHLPFITTAAAAAATAKHPYRNSSQSKWFESFRSNRHVDLKARINRHKPTHTHTKIIGTKAIIFLSGTRIAAAAEKRNEKKKLEEKKNKRRASRICERTDGERVDIKSKKSNFLK